MTMESDLEGALAEARTARSQRQSPAALTKRVEEAGSPIEPAVVFGKLNINFFFNVLVLAKFIKLKPVEQFG
ncbi:hypothetical protein [Bradyrhizobium valentinum]|nr:hypothetical protein [Bradyrhizobium valentinum]KRQ98179.1 hypothetical protein CQ10_27650 [Bradyrhizobium valentinum]